MAEHASFHESTDLLSQEIMERHRAIVSLMEELEAVDWYDQRVEATRDDEIRAVMAHNRDEEKEHAAMTLEWLRRNDPKWDDVLRTYLFTEVPIVEVEHLVEALDAGALDAGSAALPIGDLRREPAR
jgi:ferritin-like protein